MLIIFVCASAFCGCVSAEGTEAHVTNWYELQTNLTNVDVTTVILDNSFDGTLTSANITKINTTKTLNLNGNTINISKSPAERYFKVNDSGSLTINGDGRIDCNSTLFWVENGTLTLNKGVFINSSTTDPSVSVKILGSNEDKGVYSKFTLAEGAILSNASSGIGMYPQPLGAKGNGYGIATDIYGKIEADAYGITINGNLNPTHVNEHVPQICIHDGAVINTKYVAVYGAGYGIWTFEPGCTVTGSDALSIKSGNWIINGGTFTANGEYKLPPKKFDNGAEPTGAAVSITDNRVYAGNVSLVISGGKFTSQYQSALYEGVNAESGSKSALSDKGIKINGGEFITNNNTLYPIHIMNLNNTQVIVSLNGQTPFYPGLNTSSAYWVNDTTTGNWTVTLNGNIENVMSIDLSALNENKQAKVEYGNYNFVKVSNDDKYTFDGWSNDKSASDTIFEGGVEYIPIFTYIKQYDTGEEVEDDEPTPTIEPTPIVTPTPTQNQTAKPTVKPTPEPKTVVIVENEVKFEDNKVITSITVPEGSSGSITFTQTEEKGMDEWIPESIEDSYSFDLSCDGEINGDSEIHFVMSDVILKSLGLTPEDVCLKHFENGVWVKLKISYIVLDDGTYYYTAVTKSFSPFEISFDAKSEEPTVTPTEEQPTKSPMPILGLLMGLCVTALVLRRK